MTLPIITIPNPILKKKAKKISSIDSSTKKIIKDMISTLKKVEGAGLAAPQIGQSIRIIVIELDNRDKNNSLLKEISIPLTVLINPEIVKYSEKKEEDEEGCLSLPNIWGIVPRHKNITVKGINENGKKVKIKTSGSLSRILQHEIDHLNGILFTERIEDLSTLHKIGPSGEIVKLKLPKI